MSAQKHAHEFLKLRDEGMTYREIGERYGYSKEAVRSAVRRHTGALKATYECRPINAPDIYETNRVLVWDIETLPAQVHTFSLRVNGYISPKNIINPGRMTCFAGKWVGSDETMFYSEWTHGRKGMLEALWNLLDEADISITYNGDKFDIRYVSKEFAIAGLGKPSPYRSIDLIKVARQNFMLESFSMDYLAQQLIGESKIETSWGLWEKLMEGDPEAQDQMREYNIKDIDVTEALYYALRPWIKNHPIMLHETEGDSCRVCGSTSLIRKGYHTTSVSRFPRYQCDGCKTYLRSNKGERLSNLHSAQ